jgi:hypothetical protein
VAILELMESILFYHGWMGLEQSQLYPALRAIYTYFGKVVAAAAEGVALPTHTDMDR